MLLQSAKIHKKSTAPSFKLNRRKRERNDGGQTYQAYFSYLIVMVARTEENSLVRGEVELVERTCLNDNLCATFDNVRC